MRDIRFGPGEQSGYIVGESGKVLHTPDGGDTWSPVLPPAGEGRTAGF
jgi:photosystem II stability/assembly factor-like uncharacterized protein